MSLPNTSLLRLQNVLRTLPPDLVSAVLKQTGEAGGAHHMCGFVEKECAQKAKWLDCDQDSTWRDLAIDIFGGPRANVAHILRWKRERDAVYEGNQDGVHTAMPWAETMNWKRVFELLCMYYGTWYRAMKYGSRLPSLSDNGTSRMLAVFPRFLEFPGTMLEIEPRAYVGPDKRAPRAILKMRHQEEERF